MAEMTVQEAIRTALKFNQYGVAGCITNLSNKIEAMKQKEKAYAAVIEAKKALLTQQQAEIEGLKADRKETEKFYQDVNVGLCEEHFAVIKSQRAEIESLKCCGNCRWLLTSTNSDYCRKDLADYNHRKRKLRSDKCSKWERMG